MQETNSGALAPPTDAGNVATGPTQLAHRLLMCLSAIGTVLTVGWVLRYCRYGFEFTDESFYLVWIANPSMYRLSVTQFGFIYHPLYQLLDGNIASVRQVNICITFALTWVLANTVIGPVFRRDPMAKLTRPVASAAVATSALVTLVFAGSWLATPGYNSLAFQALLVAAIGLVLAEQHVDARSLTGWFLIGIGGWLAFMAKPTTAGALAFLVCMYLPLAAKFSLRLLAIPAVTAIGLVVVTALAIDGSVISFVDRLRGGLALAGTLQVDNGTNSLFRIDSFSLGDNGRLFVFLCTALFLFAFATVKSRTQALANSGSAASITFALVSVTMLLFWVPGILKFGRFQSLVLCAVPFAVVLVASSTLVVAGGVHVPRRQIALGLLFLVIPYAYAFGTGNNYWVLAANAGVFWVLASLMLIRHAGPGYTESGILLRVGIATQLVTVMLLQAGIETPYRQPQPLRNNDYPLEVGRPGSKLLLSSSFGQYLARAIAVARESGFQSGTPMIDLSGLSPGILYGINASNVGQPWTIGGYPGSDKFAAESLKGVPCSVLSSAWLLAEPNGPGKISPEVLSTFGANLKADFVVVGTVATAEGASSQNGIRIQQFLKPVRPVSVAMSECVSAKTSSK